ncbi:hypothetical protein JCM8097_005947 [Rhodosporidiobolus ruineniae]
MSTPARPPWLGKSLFPVLDLQLDRSLPGSVMSAKDSIERATRRHDRLEEEAPMRKGEETPVRLADEGTEFDAVAGDDAIVGGSTKPPPLATGPAAPQEASFASSASTAANPFTSLPPVPDQLQALSGERIDGPSVGDVLQRISRLANGIRELNEKLATAALRAQEDVQILELTAGLPPPPPGFNIESHRKLGDFHILSSDVALRTYKPDTKVRVILVLLRFSQPRPHWGLNPLGQALIAMWLFAATFVGWQYAFWMGYPPAQTFVVPALQIAGFNVHPLAWVLSPLIPPQWQGVTMLPILPIFTDILAFGVTGAGWLIFEPVLVAILAALAFLPPPAPPPPPPPPCDCGCGGCRTYVVRTTQASLRRSVYELLTGTPVTSAVDAFLANEVVAQARARQRIGSAVGQAHRDNAGTTATGLGGRNAGVVKAASSSGLKEQRALARTSARDLARLSNLPSLPSAPVQPRQPPRSRPNRTASLAAASFPIASADPTRIRLVLSTGHTVESGSSAARAEGTGAKKQEAGTKGQVKRSEETQPERTNQRRRKSRVGYDGGTAGGNRREEEPFGEPEPSKNNARYVQAPALVSPSSTTGGSDDQPDFAARKEGATVEGEDATVPRPARTFSIGIGGVAGSSSPPLPRSRGLFHPRQPPPKLPDFSLPAATPSPPTSPLLRPSSALLRLHAPTRLQQVPPPTAPLSGAAFGPADPTLGSYGAGSDPPPQPTTYNRAQQPVETFPSMPAGMRSSLFVFDANRDG